MFAPKSSMHSYLDQTKKRIDEMDAALARLERAAKKAGSRAKTGALLADLRKRRRDFAVHTRQVKSHAAAAEARMRKLRVAGALSWAAFRLALARSRKAFTRANRVTGKAVRRATK
jgi:hypothetical protein